jgi:tetratricopeptide (TPR) repeat protein
MALALLLVLAQTQAPASGADRVARSASAPSGWAGALPVECAPLESASASNVWERAKSPALRRYCDRLASSAAKLAGGGAGEADEAERLAEEADHALPGHAPPAVLRGRALARLGQWRDALAAFEVAQSLDPHALEEPEALFAWGRALGRAGRAADAEAAFHALLPRVASLPLAERGPAEIDAALLAAGRGTKGIDEAIAILREARHDAEDSLQTVALLGLALAFDRADQRDEARLALASAVHLDPRPLLAEAPARGVLDDVSAPYEADALAAIALERSDPRAAREAWSSYVAGPGGKGPWADNARAHVSRAGRGTP